MGAAQRGAGSPDVVELAVPSDARFLELINAFTEQACQQVEGLSAETVYQVAWGVHEACLNVIEHAHRFQASKPLRIRAFLYPDRVEFQIFDNGPGFNPDLVPEPDPAGVYERGRGLFGMRRCMDVVEYHCGGGTNCLRLVRLTREA